MVALLQTQSMAGRNGGHLYSIQWLHLRCVQVYASSGSHVNGMPSC